MDTNFLRKVPMFADLSEEDLGRLREDAEEIVLEAGASLFDEGDRGDHAYVICRGQIEIVKTSGGREVLLAVRREGEVIGELALLDDSPRMATARARSRTTMLSVSAGQLDDLVASSASAARAMFHTILARWTSTESMLRQSEKLAQLGTLTAGVAHELNNPASAVRRGAEHLAEAIEAFGRSATELGRAGITLDDSGEQAPVAELDPMTRSDREAEVEDLLDELGVDDGFELAPALVELGHDRPSIEKLAARHEAAVLPSVLSAMGRSFTVMNRLREIRQGAARISEIVSALKSYSYLDQAPTQLVDIHEGLESTLVVLRHKLKAGVEVKRAYADDLPRIEGYGSELNQVWTNLIDNAIDAVDGDGDGRGEILLKTEHRDGWVTVSVADDGPGISPTVVGRVFEPFVTTKPPGKGTGLGLDIAYRTVVERHRGDIDVFSEPGRTCFEVRLPVKQPTDDAAAAVIGTVSRPDDEELRRVLSSMKTIAVVGISARADTVAHSVPAYLQSKGYRVIPVNPRLDVVLGQKAYPELRDVPESVDGVVIFRRPEEVPEVVDAAIEKGVDVIWMQEGVVHKQAADRARRAGIDVVMDICIRSAHRRLLDDA